ncbi:MAG: DUF4157 domain-containing protein [Nitrospira sp.]
MATELQSENKALSSPPFTLSLTGLQHRKCACGTHTMGGGQCEECAKKRSGLQRKLVIGASNDPLEQEADRIAEQVMAAPALSHVNTAPPRIQRFTAQATGQMDTAPASVERVLASPGRPLEPTLRQDMEQRFGHDFSRIRVHTGADAEQSVRDVSAYAYTVGHNIVFGAGRFESRTSQGQQLLAHELTHVVQQGTSSLVTPSLQGNRATATINSSVVSIRRKEDTGASEAGTESEIQADTSPCASDFPCLRTPFPPGEIRFTGCTDEQLSDYAVIPEDGTETVTPTNDRWFDSDGFWSRHRQPSTQWFKVPSHCDVTITCEGHEFSCVKCCNLAASIFKGGPRWSSDPHDARNPFSNT